MWVFEEVVNGRKLSDIINETNENVKYLPGILNSADVFFTYSDLQGISFHINT